MILDIIDSAKHRYNSVRNLSNKKGKRSGEVSMYKARANGFEMVFKELIYSLELMTESIKGIATDDRLLVSLCCKYMGVDYFEFLDNLDNNKPKYAEPRHVFFFLAKEYDSRRSYQSIGDVLEKDHSTVINSISVVESIISVDKVFKNTVETIRKEYHKIRL